MDLVLRDGRTLRDVEVIKTEAGSVWLWSGKTLTTVKLSEIIASRDADVDISAKDVEPEKKDSVGELPATREVPVKTAEAVHAQVELPDAMQVAEQADRSAYLMGFAIALLVLLVGALAFALQRFVRSRDALQSKVADFEERYRPIIDFDAALRERQAELERISISTGERKAELTKLNAEVAKLRQTFQIFETEAEFVACGHYKPQFEFGTSEHYKEAITAVREKQRAMIKDERAATCSQAWLVNGSESEGRKATKRTLRLMLRAFNGECDAIIANVSWSNIDRMSERMNKAFEAINKLGESYHCSISSQYFRLRKDELDMSYGYAFKLQKEKDEQRAMREQLREEEKARREMEAAIRQAALDEERAQAALEKARSEVARATGEKESALNEKIRLLEQKLAEAHTNKERAISRAEQTRSGHVYIISNIGSFGESVFKIGMTRRLDPLERIDELSDASVPFEFDVHGMIYTEDAPGLEAKLHARFAERRVNLINEKKEFFQASIDEIQTAVQQLGASVILTKLAEAREYRETVERRRAAAQPEIEARAG